MPGDLYIGGGVYIYIPVITDTFWPVAGVTKPQHLWPFCQTGDYTDQGSTAGLDLTEGGFNNSFDADGLVLTHDGWATVAIDPDVGSLGSVYSIIVEFNVTGGTNFWPAVAAAGASGTNGWIFMTFKGSSPSYFYWSVNTDISYDSTGQISSGNFYQLVVTSSGTGADQVNYYINGVWDSSHTFPAMTPASGLFYMGRTSGGSVFTGKIRRVGILKNEAWSADDVAAIYTAFS